MRVPTRWHIQVLSFLTILARYTYPPKLLSSKLFQDFKIHGRLTKSNLQNLHRLKPVDKATLQGWVQGEDKPQNFISPFQSAFIIASNLEGVIHLYPKTKWDLPDVIEKHPTFQSIHLSCERALLISLLK